MTESQLKELEQWAEMAGKLANRFHGGEFPCCRWGEGGTCIQRQETTALTPAELRRGDRRAFCQYRHGELCLNCATYWHASMLQQTLQRNCAIERRYRPELPAAQPRRSRAC